MNAKIRTFSNTGTHLSAATYSLAAFGNFPGTAAATSAGTGSKKFSSPAGKCCRALALNVTPRPGRSTMSQNPSRAR